jgi:hypothetical protein
MDSILRASRPVLWIRAARKDFEDFPEAAQTDFLRALTIVAGGRTPDVAKPLKGLGSGVLELALRHRGDAFRVVCAAQARKGDAAMTDEPIEIVRGSGNVFRDFAHPDADREQLRAILAARMSAGFPFATRMP